MDKLELLLQTGLAFQPASFMGRDGRDQINSASSPNVKIHTVSEKGEIMRVRVQFAESFSQTTTPA